VRFQFSRLPHARWAETRERLARESSMLDWVFGPGTAQPETLEELCDEYGYLLRFRFETLGAVRRIRLRAEDPRRSTDWVPLDACAMTPDGLLVPGAKPRRRSPGPRPASQRRTSRGAALVSRPREEQVLVLKEALVSAARFRTRPTWEDLCRTTGSDLLELPEPDHADLLLSVEQTVGGEDGPLLSALLRTEEGDCREGVTGEESGRAAPDARGPMCPPQLLPRQGAPGPIGIHRDESAAVTLHSAALHTE